MSKRPKRKAEFDEESSAKKKKRKKHQDGTEQQTDPSSQEKAIENAQDLRFLTSSTAPEVDELFSRINQFKLFLDSIVFPKNEDTSSKTSILVEYLRSQISENENHPSLMPDVFKIAHHACQVNSEKLYSSVITVIALLLKAISGLHELAETGNSLCRLLLHDDHISLVGRGMSAAKPKEHLISPCLRLLREVVLFDGGRATRAIYRQRHVTFQRLDVFLTMRGTINEGTTKSRKQRLSVRNNAISYTLANLRLQDQTAKCFILGRNKWMKALLSDISDDPPGLVYSVLEILRKDVAEDSEIPLAVKGRLFDDWALHRLVTLYGFKNDAPENGKPGIRDLAHRLLQTIFVSSDHSLLIAVDSESAGVDLEKTGSDSDEDSALRGSADTRRIRQNLFSFMKHLRPHANIRQSDLLVSCFQTSPPLLQDYFSDKLAFSFDPKLSATWIGYSQFILSILQQPFPESLLQKCLKKDSPPLDLLFDHILLPPLTQKVLTRCFHQSSPLIKFLASRIIVAAFDKLIAARDALRSLGSKGTIASTGLADDISSRLLELFSQRLPIFKDIASQLKASPKTAIMLRESLARLLVYYYRETPHLASGENFDISTSLSDSLVAFGQESIDGRQDGMLSLMLDHLMQIASRSATMQWWHKSDTTPLSPFSKLLKAYVEDVQSSRDVRLLLKSLMEQNYLIWPTAAVSGFDIIVQILKNKETLDRNPLYEFLDNCIVRCVKKSLMYLDLLDELKDLLETEGRSIHPTSHPDLLLVALMEQLPYLVARKDGHIAGTVAIFLKRYIELLAKRGANRSLLLLIRDKMRDCFENNDECHQLYGKILEEPFDSEVEHQYSQLASTTTDHIDNVGVPTTLSNLEIEPEVDFPPGPPIEDKDHHGLNRWLREDVRDAIADGMIADLMMCLCSEFEEIRKQALIAMGKFMQKLEFSGYPEWRQIYLLAGEMKETATSVESNDTLPNVAGVFATHFLQILINPLHFLYVKVNKFLNKGPQWTVEKLPSYWTDKILLQPPTEDDSHYREIEWLLTVLTDALRTQKDMEIYKQSQILEKILTLAASPRLPAACFEKITDLLFRCSYVGGSTTLITRCGLMSWLAGHVILKDGLIRSKLVLLGRRVYESSNQKLVNEWSGEDLSIVVARLRHVAFSRND